MIACRSDVHQGAPVSGSLGAKLITDYEFIKEDSPFCLTRAITRTMIGPCYTNSSLKGLLGPISSVIPRKKKSVAPGQAPWRPRSPACYHASPGASASCSASFLLSLQVLETSLSLKLSDARVYEPQTRALLRTASHLCVVPGQAPWRRRSPACYHASPGK